MKRKSNKKEKKRTNRKTKHIRGGWNWLWPFGSRANQSKCPNANKCDLTDTQYSNKLNETWKTCIKMNKINNDIYYITPQNVTIKSIETVQIPEFVVNLGNSGSNDKCKIMIEDKYIGCFLYFCGNWYAIMRLFGKTLNEGLLARTEANRAFFKLYQRRFETAPPRGARSKLSVELPVENSNGLKGSKFDFDANDPNKGNSVVGLDKDIYTEVSIQQVLSTSDSKTIKLVEGCYENIDKKSEDVFKILQEFRLQKVLGNNIKRDAVDAVGEGVIEGVGDALI
jgi:hypothetical protein